VSEGIQVWIDEDAVSDLRGVIAQLEIAVYETRVITLDPEREQRLERMIRLTNSWGRSSRSGES
jgi:hypothetical protein